MIYVPVYNPAEIYGRWPDHDYLPVFVPPPPNFYSAGIGFSIQRVPGCAEEGEQQRELGAPEQDLLSERIGQCAARLIEREPLEFPPLGRRDV
jgi:hypothetical protein